MAGLNFGKLKSLCIVTILYVCVYVFLYCSNANVFLLIYRLIFKCIEYAELFGLPVAGGLASHDQLRKYDTLIHFSMLVKKHLVYS